VHKALALVLLLVSLAAPALAQGADPHLTIDTAATALPTTSGFSRLELEKERDAYLYVPATLNAAVPAPLVVVLHGAGGTAGPALQMLQAEADRWGAILLAPQSRRLRWDAIEGSFGPDVDFIARALSRVLASYRIDRGHMALAGISDGATYALSLGLANGDRFGHVMAFSPGFVAPTRAVGKPRFYVSHGTQDTVLPIGETSRVIVPQLKARGYDVQYDEFDGGHRLPPDLAARAMRRFLGPS
jgi:phospholipase/carboxylesterase